MIRASHSAAPTPLRSWFRRGLALALATSAVSLAACSDTTTVEPVPDEAPTITLNGPNGGQAYEPGSTIEIQWTATDDNGVTGVDLSYTADGGKAGSIATGQTGNSYMWTTPSENLFGVKVTVVASDAENQTGQDVSDDMFAVVHVSARGYVTSSVCGTCHALKQTELFNSGHPYKINKVVNGAPPTYPFSAVPSPPVGFTWNDISYVIGGYGWKARFMDENGYILVNGITGVDTQYNLPRDDLGDGLPAGWVSYEGAATDPKPYTCGGCHTTGWQTSAENGNVHQDGLAGILGTWEEPGITCEACHGAGGAHVVTQSGSDVSIDTDKELCGSCHFRDTNHGILVSGTYIKHHEQYDEMISAGHTALSCTDCHDPHIGARYGNAEAGGIIATCEGCHTDKTSNAHAVPVDCVTCHMPRASKSARAVQTFQGDLRTHIFKINSTTATRDDMFYESDGAKFSRGWVSLEFACYQCHTDPISGVGGGKSEKTLAELSAKATGIHN